MTAEPDQDQVAADRFRELAALRAELAQLLDEVGQPSTVDTTPDMVPHECWHPTADHGQWGCTVGGCKCPRPRHAFGHGVGES